MTSLGRFMLRAAGGMLVEIKSEESSRLELTPRASGFHTVFKVWDLGAGRVALQSFTGTFVTSDESMTVAATAENITASAIFTRLDLGNGAFVLCACNGKYVGKCDGGDKVLLANRTTIGPCEIFSWVPPSSYPAKASVATRLGGIRVEFDFGAGDRGRFQGNADEGLAAGVGVGTTVFKVPPETLYSYEQVEVGISVFFPFTTCIEWYEPTSAGIVGEMNAAGLAIPGGGRGRGKFHPLPR